MTTQATPTAPMNVLVVGLGVIGTTYGYLFQKAGHHIEHLVRQSSTRASVSSLEVEILDGRTDPKGSLSQDQYTVHHRGHTSYDLIVVSVPQGRIAEAMADLRTGEIEGPVLLFCGFWGEREELDRLMAGRDVLLGYPVSVPWQQCTATSRTRRAPPSSSWALPGCSPGWSRRSGKHRGS